MLLVLLPGPRWVVDRSSGHTPTHSSFPILHCWHGRAQTSGRRCFSRWGLGLEVIFIIFLLVSVLHTLNFCWCSVFLICPLHLHAQRISRCSAVLVVTNIIPPLLVKLQTSLIVLIHILFFFCEHLVVGLVVLFLRCFCSRTQALFCRDRKHFRYNSWQTENKVVLMATIASESLKKKTARKCRILQYIIRTSVLSIVTMNIFFLFLFCVEKDTGTLLFFSESSLVLNKAESLEHICKDFTALSELQCVCFLS